MEPDVTLKKAKVGKPFPIVAIGASAGGLNALQCFIGALPKEFGFAVVFMQHLSTKHRSLLPELLHNRRPDIPVHEISEPVRILPGKIYLCPPGKEVRVEKGTFRATTPSEDHIHLPIDEFFSSLAENVGERVIAVILSGAGTDGARGIQAIRNAGGAVFVQDPATAEFPAMPLAAIATARADRVLPADDIAREILKLHGVVPAAEADFTPAEFEAFSRLIHEKTGHGFSHFKKSVVGRRIRRRMYLRGVSLVRDYMAILAENDSEAAGLAADLMIGVTSFFRDRLAWKALGTGVIRKFAAAADATPLRVWTPACATGEEAYSIAMMLRHEFDLAGKNRQIQVFATDVNDIALEKAREGIYPGSIVADVPTDYMKKFFTCSEDGISVIVGKETREAVVFARQDLIADPPFSRLDLIICRNLLIYLEPDAQERCIALFHYALKDGGYLFLGNAESPGRKSPLFKSLAHKKCRIYQKIETGQPTRLSLAVPFASERAAMPPPVQATAECRQSTAEFVQQALLEESGPPAVAINQHYDIVYNNGPTNRYLRPPRGAPTQNLLALFPENLKSRIRGALYRAAQEARPVVVRANIAVDDRRRPVTLRVSKLGEKLFLIVFREKGRVPAEAEEPSVETAAVEDRAVRQLESELASTRAELQSNIEQLKSLNEELQSSNEELQAANEELETSREELQSLNEELITVNSQLQSKIEEQEETNNDLNNFLTSTNIPTVFLDHRFRVKRFTPAMSKLIKLIPADVGRPIGDMSQENLGPDFFADAESVLEHLAPIRKDIRVNGTWYVRTALPYRTADNRIEGVVVTYSDVTELKRSEEKAKHLASFPQLNPNPVIEVDYSGKIIFFNPATESILESVGMNRDDVDVFLPADTDVILKHLGKKEETSLTREVTVGDRVFGETIHISPGFNVFRIYAYEITEIRKAEQISGRLAAIVESADDAIMSKDLNGIITTWNIGAEKIFGYTAEEAIGRHISFLAPAGHKDETQEILRRIASGEHIDHFETERVRKDGTVIPVSLIFSPITDAEGKVVGASKIAHDITERKRTEEVLRESEGRLRAALESAEMGTWSVDVEKGTVDWDVRCRTIFGLPERESVPLEDALFRIVEGDRAMVQERIAAALLPSSDGKYDVEYRVIGLEDHLQWIRATGQTLFEGSGERRRAKRFIGVVMDMTERRNAEEALKESGEQFRTLADSIPNLAWWANADGYITWYNRRWYEYTGTTPEKMEGWGWQMVHDPEVLPGVMERWKASIATGEPFDMEFPLRGADGVFRPFLTRILPLKDQAGKVLRWFGTNTDISALKQAENALLQAKQEQEKHSAQLQTILDHLTEGLVVADLEANLFHWNPAAVAMHGFSGMEECRRKLPEFTEIFELSTEEDGILPLEQWPLARILSGETLNNWEVRIRRPGSDWQRVFSYGGTLARNKEGKPLLAVVTVADVTERRRSEEDLHKLNRTLRALSDSSQAIIRAESEPAYMNDVCRVISEDCGYSMVWIGFAVNDDAKSVRPVAHAGFEDGYLETLKITWADTERGRGPTGTAIRTGRIAVCRNMLTDPAFTPWRDQAVERGYASSIVFPLTADDRVFGAITIYSKESDPFTQNEIGLLTELADNLAYGIEVLRMRAAREKVEESLKHSLSRFELLTVTAGELLQSTEPQKVVESVCRKVMEYLDCHAFFNFLVDEEAGKLHLNACAGIPEEEAGKIAWLDFGVAVCGCAAREGQRVIAEHIPTTPDERTELVKSYGVKAYCCHPLLGPRGRVIGTLSFGTCSRETFSEEDISLMKAVSDQVAVAMIRMKGEADVLKLGEDMAARNVELERANREMEAFIYSISHDLRAPLRSMAGFARILNEDFAQRLDEQGKDYLGRILRGAAKMARLIDDLLDLSRVSRQEMEKTEVDLSAIAASVISDMREADPGRRIDVTIEQGLSAFADRRLAEIVLSNLLGNAWKFTSAVDNASIQFGASEQEGKTVYYIRDNGAGFDAEFMEKMFLPFQRLHSDQEFEGTGIGLTIVELIIDRHGGRVWAEGQKGKGATVYFTLRPGAASSR